VLAVNREEWLRTVGAAAAEECAVSEKPMTTEITEYSATEAAQSESRCPETIDPSTADSAADEREKGEFLAIARGDHGLDDAHKLWEFAFSECEIWTIGC